MTKHDAELAPADTSVQVVALKAPLELRASATCPVGGPPSADTVVVHVLAVPTSTVPGVHETVVVVWRPGTVTLAEPTPAAFTVSPE